jgi:aminoglycoside N3'-acetyltransferase
MDEALSQQELEMQLRSLGVRPGMVLIVHTAFSAIKPVQGGPLSLIGALQSVLGENGTLVMPSFADNDDHPFDPRSSTCGEMGIVAETFWRLPKVSRSDSPHAFAAWGSSAKRITAPHPLEIPHGLDSPVGRVYEMNGHILLLGVGQDANTSVHLAENLAPVPYRRQCSSPVWKGGLIDRVYYHEPDHCCQNFALVDRWLADVGKIVSGQVGHGIARLMNSQGLVTEVLKKLRREPLVFLHPLGVCEECDDARRSVTI